MHRKFRLVLFLALGGLALSALPAAIPAAYAAASLQLSRLTAAPGDAITVKGLGFAPNGSAVVITKFQVGSKTQQVQSAVTANGAGSFSLSVTVPDGASPGVYRVSARDFQKHRASRALTVLPLVLLKSGGSPPTVTVTAAHGFFARGSGFGPNESVTITASFPLYSESGNSLSVNKSVTTDAHGAFGEIFVKVPDGVKVGKVTLTATGQTSKNAATAALDVVYHPTLSVKPATAPPGSKITVNGSGFVPNGSVAISVTIPRQNAASVTLSRTVNTGPKGGVSTTFTLPLDIKAGLYTVSATGTLSGAKASDKVRVALTPVISFKPSAIEPGGTITVNGNGFSANASVTITATVPLYGGGSKTVSVTAHTGSGGGFTTHLAIPGNAAGGTLAVTAAGPNGHASAHLMVGRLSTAIALSAASVIPGSSVSIAGSGYPSGDTVTVTLTVKTTSGAQRTLSTTVHPNAQGKFSAKLAIPADVAGGAYTVTATSHSTGRAPSARLTILNLKPSLVAAPMIMAPGAQVTATGFGFAAGAHVKIAFHGQQVGTATADAAGKFTARFSVPAAIATGTYAVTAKGAAGRTASAQVKIQRSVSTHFYFASIFTGPGHLVYLAFVNPSTIGAQVTITYQLTNGTTKTRTVTVGPQSRFTEDAVADLGSKVSAAAAVSADVPIAASLLEFQGRDGAVIPGSRAPATIWYFANGNTSGAYREYIAIQNPNTSQSQVTVQLLPTHHAPMTLVRTMAPTSRLTINVNRFVRDAVGVTVTANAPVVANRTIKIKNGMNSKNGVHAAQHLWYFATGSQNPSAKFWLGMINPSSGGAYVTVRAYGQYGRLLSTVSQKMKGHARVGLLVNKVAHTPDASVVVSASRAIIAEQTTYVGGKHAASTDSFGVPSPAKSWAFPAADTSNARGASDYLVLFNPNLAPAPIVVQVMTTSGKVIERTYVVGPLYHQRIDVGSLAPNAQLGIVTTSSVPFVALNRNVFNSGAGSASDPGIAL